MWKWYILFIVCSEVYASLLHFLDEILLARIVHLLTYNYKKMMNIRKKMVQDASFISSLFN